MTSLYIELGYTTKLTTKSDVYSFGVLTLEVLMGKQPWDLIPALSSSSGQNRFLKDVLDQRLPLPLDHVAEEVISTMMLALSCIHSNPQSRPSMRHVSQQLSTHRLHILEPLHGIKLYQLMNANE